MALVYKDIVLHEAILYSFQYPMPLAFEMCVQLVIILIFLNTARTNLIYYILHIDIRMVGEREKCANVQYRI